MALHNTEFQHALRLLLHEEYTNSRLGFALLTAHPEQLKDCIWELLVAAHMSKEPPFRAEIQEVLTTQLAPDDLQKRQAALEIYTIHKRRIYDEKALDVIVEAHLPYSTELAQVVLRNALWAKYYMEMGYWLQHQVKLHLDVALMFYKLMLVVHPDHLIVRYEMAILHRGYMEDYQQAIYCYQEILSRAPEEHRALDAWAMLYVQYIKHYYDRAIELLKKACAIAPEKSSYHLHLAMAYDAAGYTDAHEEQLRQLVEQFPSYPEGLVSAANYWTNTYQNHTLAEELYHRAIKSNPRDVYALGNLAELYAEALGDYNRAKDYYYKTMRRQLHPYFMTNFISLLVLHLNDLNAGKKYYLKRAEMDADRIASAEAELSDEQILAFQQAEQKLLRWLAS